jgi:hypothetical protein
MRYYPAIKENEMSFAAKWMELEDRIFKKQSHLSYVDAKKINLRVQ